MEDVPGRTMPVDNGKTVFAELPATTFRYTSTPWMDSATSVNGLGQDATVCANEYGVSMEMSITAFSNRQALAADPLVETGVTEFTAVDLVICQSRTARDGIKLLASIMDTYGSSEVNIAFIADQQEAWYMEMYTGHQYAAVRLPRDKVCVFGNEFTLEYLSEYEECITSPGLFTLPKEHGFAQTSPAGEMNLYLTYSGSEVRTGYSHMRTWIGHQALAPSVYGDTYREDAWYPLCFAPDEKVSLSQAMALIRNRYEGTEYAPDATRRTDMRVIGTDTALSVHILQIFEDMPADRAVLTWESVAPAVYGVFVPVSNASLRVSDAYGRCQPAEEAGSFDSALYPWYAFKEINTLCVEPDLAPVYGAHVRRYWQQAENDMITATARLMNETRNLPAGEAAERLTDYCCAVQEQAFADAKAILNLIRYTMAGNSNTMKNGRNPETGEILDEQRQLTPMEIKLENNIYRGE